MAALIFLGSLFGAIAIGMPIAFALLACALALMAYMGGINAQILRCVWHQLSQPDGSFVGHCIFAPSAFLLHKTQKQILWDPISFGRCACR